MRQRLLNGAHDSPQGTLYGNACPLFWPEAVSGPGAFEFGVAGFGEAQECALPVAPFLRMPSKSDAGCRDGHWHGGCGSRR